MTVEDAGEQRRNLDVRFLGGVAWTAGSKWATQILSWVALSVQARLLSTSDFGISEMASYFFGFTNVLAEFGVGTAVLQMQELDNRVWAQLHTVSCVICTSVFLLSIPLAPLIAAFFHAPHLTSLIIAMNVGFFITGFQTIPSALLQKDMDYRRLSYAEGLQNLVQSVLTVWAAWAGFGYWSLIIGAFLGKSSAAALVSYWKPVAFAMPKWEEVKGPLRLGGQTAIGRLAWACYTQADGIIVGRVLGQSVLGIYRMAINLASAPAEKISSLIMRATGPLFAKIQSDPTLVRRYFLILTELLTMVELPLMLGLGTVAPETIRLFLGPRWADAVYPLQWLVLFMTLRTLSTLGEQVLISQRATQFTMRMSLLNFCIMPPAFYFGSRWLGTSGAAAAWLALAPITILPVIWMTLRKVNAGLLEMLNALMPGVVGTAVMVVALYGFRIWLDPLGFSTGTRLILQIAGGGTVYAAVLGGLFNQRLSRYVRFAKSLRGGMDKEASAVAEL